MLAHSLYENEYYQSAAYYFNEVLTIPASLLDSKSASDNQFYTDVNPDYHMEANVYVAKCQLMFDYYQVDSIIKSNSDKDEFDLVFTDSDGNKASHHTLETVELIVLHQKLVKLNQILVKHILEWKLHETNRASFLFSQEKLDKIKADKDSQRLRDLLETCNECLIYICFKMERHKECVMYMEQCSYLLDTDLNGLYDHTEAKFESEAQFVAYFATFEHFDQILKSVNQKVLRYKFAFNCKLLYAFLIEPAVDENATSSIVHATQTKMTVILSEHFSKIPGNHKKLDSQFDFLYKKFEKIQNDWVRKNLSSIECRDVPTDDIELRRLREKNRVKEKNFFNYMHKDMTNGKTKFAVELILNGVDLVKLKLSEKLRENRLDANKQSIYSLIH